MLDCPEAQHPGVNAWGDEHAAYLMIIARFIIPLKFRAVRKREKTVVSIDCFCFRLNEELRTQGFSAAVNPRHDGTNGNIQELGDLTVGKFFD